MHTINTNHKMKSIESGDTANHFPMAIYRKRLVTN